MQTTLTLTKDGSHTLFVPNLGEHYHSIHGAIQESRHVFINAGLRACTAKTLHILEVGFGTGLNALLTLIVCTKHRLHANYTAIEPFPLAEETWKQLNYPQLLANPLVGESFVSLHIAPYGEVVAINQRFSLYKTREGINTATLQSERFDLIFFDAFGPTIQPELWTAEVFEKLYKTSAKNGILVTYAAKGLVRRNMTEAGYSVERLPGPPGKREMLRATKL
ncbi:MAG: tRNA (5-methylaminomethyl-2-thiouridine)(34)-methyltransferase MnmD [Bacteroidales bacterium]|nr:tRNA (5-methylaminomethyl-2-thiouridine)(34)-methyltransferase MnmD [Bacteroidales bacterium]MDZ4205235.1 tRNA (5-methylaminomethyl-2-thiouridine)(34)-methyltransferase MnmD [Bacteroidales bacterium]